MAMAAPRRSQRPLSSPALHELAQFRYQLRQFLRFSERVARDAGLTPLQHQLLLGTAGFTGRGWATITELAEYLQERHNSVVALVTRAAQAGLVRRTRCRDDHRVVRVDLTPKGRRLLVSLTHLHQQELARFPILLSSWSPGWQPPASEAPAVLSL